MADKDAQERTPEKETDKNVEECEAEVTEAGAAESVVSHATSTTTRVETLVSSADGVPAKGTVAEITARIGEIQVAKAQDGNNARNGRHAPSSITDTKTQLTGTSAPQRRQRSGSRQRGRGRDGNEASSSVAGPRSRAGAPSQLEQMQDHLLAQLYEIQDRRRERRAQEKLREVTMKHCRGFGDAGFSKSVEPNLGKGDKKVEIVTNHIKVRLTPELLCQYEISITPDCKNFNLIQSIINDHAIEAFGAFKNCVYHKPNTIYSVRRISENREDTFRSKVPDRNRDSETVYTITFKLKEEMDINDIPGLVMCNQVIKGSFVNDFGFAMDSNKNRLVDRSQSRTVTHGPVTVEVTPGISAPIHSYDHGHSMAVNVTNKIEPTTASMLNNMMALAKSEAGEKRNPQKAIKRQYVGQTIIHRPDNKKYKITDIDFTKNASTPIPYGRGEKSMVDIYNEKFRQVIQDKKQPLIQFDKKEGREKVKDYVLPEMCMMPNQTSRDQIPLELLKSLRKVTARKPDDEHKVGLQNVYEKLTDEAFRGPNFGVHAVEPLRIYARQFEQEKLTMRSQGDMSEFVRFVSKKPSSWDQELDGHYLLVCPPDLKIWTVVFLAANEKQVKEFLDHCSSAAKAMGWKFKRPQMVKITSPRDYVPNIRARLESEGDAPEIIMAFLKCRPGPNYPPIKKVCLWNGVQSQCVTMELLSRAKGEIKKVARNVAIQMACKLGAEPWQVKQPLQDVMFVGIDRWDDCSTRSASVFALVASRNPNCTRFFSQYEEAPANRRYSNKIRFMIQNALRAYKETCGKLPAKIIAYRAGVAESDFENVIEHEGMGILEALRDKEMCAMTNVVYDETYEPEWAYLVLRQARRHRFYVHNPVSNKLENPPGGTVIDTGLTTPGAFDFYLIPQSRFHNTITPINYNIIANTTRLKPDQFQRLTFKLCHLYFNIDGVVRYPNVVCYAKKLARLIGEIDVSRRPGEARTNPGELVNACLQNTLYYL